MRILLINKFHYLRGGAERAYFDTARILAESGHHVAFFSMQHPENHPTEWSHFFVARQEYSEGNPTLGERFRLARNILWNFEAARKLEALIHDFQPEVAHLHNIYHQLSPSIIWTLKRHRIPIVMTLHDYKLLSPNYSLFVRGKIWEHTSGWRCLMDRCVMDSFAKSLICALEKWLHDFLGSYQKVDHFIAPSRFLIEKFRALGSPLTITHVPQPLSPFPSAVLTPTEEYYLSFGRLSKEKGVDRLLGAWSQGDGTMKLKIAGTGPDEARLKERVQDENLTGIEFVGYQTGEALESLIQKAKAIILSSVWYENMPYSLVEALARGKVVIAPNLGGIPERIVDGENGFLYESGNTKDLVRVLREFDQHDLNLISKKARESTEDLREDAYKKALESLYTELLSRSKLD